VTRHQYDEVFVFLFLMFVATLVSSKVAAEEMTLRLRYQKETVVESGRFHVLHRNEKWKPSETAIIVCDAWDYHHCLNAVRRLEQFAPRLDKVLEKARTQGVTIIHAPSDCMEAYGDHSARRRAQSAPAATKVPKDIESWCSSIPAEGRSKWPIDQSDGGEDDDEKEHAEWAKKLAAMGLPPGHPWTRQTPLLTIDAERDYISDKGNEVWNVLESKGIRNVILAGVHTNMCVIGRPFGLRRMVNGGKNVVLMRDMTDTMYNPQRWPYVSHFTGTDLVVSHIERYVCPTITSDQIIQGKPFRFANDKRPRLVVISAEDEYGTKQTLPEFAIKHLGHDFHVTMLFGDAEKRNHIPGMDAVDSADILLVSIRRRWLPPKDMQRLRDFVQSGKPVVGIRTASHAFSVRGEKPTAGLSEWASFDREVFGGNYHDHHGNQLKSTVRVSPNASHPILVGLTSKAFPQGGSLYKTSPLSDGATLLLTGSVSGHPDEPAAWTFKRADGGKSFYTSLGSIEDFSNVEFQRLLLNGLRWAAGIEQANVAPVLSTSQNDFRDHWAPVRVPDHREQVAADKLPGTAAGVGWYRCAVRLPASWLEQTIKLDVNQLGGRVSGWMNGNEIRSREDGTSHRFTVSPKRLYVNDANLLVLRVESAAPFVGLTCAPIIRSGSESLRLEGRWQFRFGDDEEYANIPLPAKFGTSADIFFSPKPQ
jgi:nicotinamidase-related amidase